MFVLVRAVVYASLFIGTLLVFVPARLLAWSGIAAPSRFGAGQGLGALLTCAGGMLALSCVLAFALVGRGTPAPFDPPRRLVAWGPYRWVRNPMYVGAGTAVSGAALYYHSLPLFAYAVAFLLAMHGFVVWYEEPALRRMFGREYEEYCRRVGRWWPRAGSGPVAPDSGA